MRSLDSWFSEYGESHRHPLNKKIHKVCVPAIFFSILIMLRAIPRTEFMSFAPEWALNWATLNLVGPLLFYFLLDRVLFGLMLPQVVVMLWGAEMLMQASCAFSTGLVIFVLAWAGQFYGHKVEGKKPSFLKDLAFLLIGPLWVTRAILPTQKAS